MSGTNNTGINPAASASGEVLTLLQEKMSAKIKEASLKAENLLNYFDVQDVTGTDRIGEKFMGDTELEVLAPGQAPNGSPVEFDKNTLVVDTVVIGRNYQHLLSAVQSDINGLHSKLVSAQVREHKKLEDEMTVQQLIFAGMANTKANRSTPRVSGHGFSEQVAVKETIVADPEGVEACLDLLLERMLEGKSGGDGVDLSKLTILMPWAHFNTLRDAERIVNRDYQTFAGDTVSGFALKSFNIPVVPSNRFPRGAKKSKLSKPSNGNRYDATAEMANVVAIVFGTEALLVGKSIDLESKIWYSDDTKSWVIDSWQSEGAIGSSWEECGLVVKGTAAGADDTAVVARANRKATRTKGALAA